MSDTTDYSELLHRARNQIGKSPTNPDLVVANEDNYLSLIDAVEKLQAELEDRRLTPRGNAPYDELLEAFEAMTALARMRARENDQLSSIVRDLAKSFDEEACSFCRLWTGQGEHDPTCPVLRARQLFPDES